MDIATFKDHAPYYAQKGYGVIPLKPRTKNQPLVKWKVFQTRRPDEKEFNEWVSRWPSANIALVTGKINNLVVFDEDGPEAVKLIKKNGGVPLGPQSITSRGRQYFYKYPDFEVRGDINKKMTLDIRAEGNYVVVPPSIHPSGKRYQWAFGLSLFEIELPKLREWQIEYLQEHCRHNENESNNQSGWQTKFLKGVQKGERNNIATKLAGRYFGKGLLQAEILMFLEGWNKRNKPPLSKSELMGIIESVEKIDIRNHQKQNGDPQNGKRIKISFG